MSEKTLKVDRSYNFTVAVLKSDNSATLRKGGSTSAESPVVRKFVYHIDQIVVSLSLP